MCVHLDKRFTRWIKTVAAEQDASQKYMYHLYVLVRSSVAGVPIWRSILEAYLKQIYDDYKFSCGEVVKNAKERPFKAAFNLSTAVTLG